jgi:dihydrofolate reductase/thymidylate synthase
MLSLIVAQDKSGGIGKDGKLPWKNAKDMANFTKVTKGNVVIMGRKTWESIPDKFRPLPDRENIVISKTLKADISVFKDIDTCLVYLKKIKDREIFVIGGSSIYQQFLERNLIHKLYITTIDDTFDCDSFVDISGLDLKDIYEEMLDKKVNYKVSIIRNQQEEQILDVMKDILDNGVTRGDRTGIGTLSLFSRELRFSLENGNFPLITTRPLPLRQIFEELMWFLRGQTDVKILEKKKINVWSPNSTREFLDKRSLNYKVGDIGPSYGFQFRHYGAKYIDSETDYTGQGYDQLSNVIDLLKNNPDSRRIMINLWNPPDLNKTALPPCGFCYQFYVANGYLSCKVTQRSSDISLAGGWNVASASLFTYMLASICNLKPKEVIWSTGDTHLYLNQLDSVKKQLRREPRQFPKLEIIKVPENITEFEYDCIKLKGYYPYKRIKFKMNA